MTRSPCRTPRSPPPAAPPSGASRRRPRRGPAAAVAGLLLIAAGAGCTGERAEGQAADPAVVPSDPSVVTERADRARVRGDTAADVRILEVADFQCPFCREYFRKTYPAIDSLYVQTGKVEYVWLAFPNPNHQRSWQTLEAAFCAGAVGKFWPMHDRLFREQQEWANAEDLTEQLVAYARDLGIDGQSFRECMVEDRPSGLIVQDYGTAARGGVRGTPFFLVQDSAAQALQGAQSLSRFRQVLDGMLAR